MQLPRDKNDWPELWRDQYEERAAILQFRANFPRWQAEDIAEQAVRKMAWESTT